MLIDTVFDKTPCSANSTIVNVNCKEGFIHDFVWFEILSTKRCMHCGKEKI